MLLASRHPNRVKDSSSFVTKGEKPLSDWEFDLITAAKAYPIDLTNIADHCPTLPTPKVMEPKHQALPKISMDKVPWMVDPDKRDVEVAGKLLTKFERRLVVCASIYPHQFKKNGEYKVGGKLTG